MYGLFFIPMFFFDICMNVTSSGSYTIQGRRVRVYQPEFEECWALGLVSQHDPISHIMEITLDKVNYIYFAWIASVDGAEVCHLHEIFVLQGDENQTVDPRVIHVMLAEEEVRFFLQI